MKERNIGVDLLRILLSFLVIQMHVGIHELFQSLAVPCFMFLSFYFMSDKIINCDIRGIKKQIIRLLIPYVFWSTFYWLGYYALGRHSTVADTPNLHDLCLQFITGHNKFSGMQLWYINCLLIIIMFLSFISYLEIFNKNIKKVYIGILFFSLFIQYSDFYSNYANELGIEWSYIQICYMIPYAVLGILFAHYLIFSRLEIFRYETIFISIISFIFLYYFGVINQPHNADTYAGVDKIIYTLLIVFVFFLIPYKYIPAKIQKKIAYISKYSLGIYCIHYGYIIIINIMKSKDILPEYIFGEALLVYVVSWITSYIISLLPFKLCNRLVT